MGAAPSRSTTCQPPGCRRSKACVLCGPVQNNLAALPGEHRGESILEPFSRVMVGDDGEEIEPALQHGDHLVPGLEHLAAVDALDLEALENDLVPIDRHLRGRYAQHRDLAAVIHVH